MSSSADWRAGSAGCGRWRSRFKPWSSSPRSPCHVWSRLISPSPRRSPATSSGAAASAVVARGGRGRRELLRRADRGLRPGSPGRARRLPRPARPGHGGAPGPAARAAPSAPVDLGRARGAPPDGRPRAARRPQRRRLAARRRARPVAQSDDARRARPAAGRAPHRPRRARFRPGGLRLRGGALARREGRPRQRRRSPSRWLVRLQTLLASHAAGAELAPTEAARLGASSSTPWPGVPRPTPQPQPKPPLAARPRRLSVSDIGTWMERPLRALRQAHPRPQAARGARCRPRRARARHHRPPRARALRQAYPDALPDDAVQHLLRARPRAVRASSPTGRGAARCGGRASCRSRAG